MAVGRQAMRVAYFTAGTVGAGHLMRGIAIGRGLRRAGFGGAYRMFGPRLPFPAARRAGLPADPADAADAADAGAGPDAYQEVEVESDAALRQPHLAQTSGLARALAAFAPDLLLVDLFWAPLRWVLPALSCPAWLLVRRCPAVWLQGPPGLPFQRGQYERLLAIEPLAQGDLDARLDPIVVANPDECRTPAELRELWHLPAGADLVAVAHAGEAGELAVLRQAAGVAAPLVFDLFDASAPFPAAPWLAAADRVVAGLGYNSYWEARWLGFATRTRFVAFRRSIDDQDGRLAAGAASVMRGNGADTLARLILG
jgi:hypothetical protein